MKRCLDQRVHQLLGERLEWPQAVDFIEEVSRLTWPLFLTSFTPPVRMIARAHAVESLIYRTAGLIDARIGATPHDAADGSAALAALEEYAIEASIAKVAGSETLNFVLDENIQIHGGNGYVRDYPAERHFRDARVNRIFEGTNEINRLLIPGMLARRAVKGTLPIIAAAKALLPKT